MARLVIPALRSELKIPKGEARRQGREKAWMHRERNLGAKNYRLCW